MRRHVDLRITNWRSRLLKWSSACKTQVLMVRVLISKAEAEGSEEWIGTSPVLDTDTALGAEPQAQELAGARRTPAQQAASKTSPRCWKVGRQLRTDAEPVQC